MFHNTVLQFKIVPMPHEMVKTEVKKKILHYPVCLAFLEVLKGNAIHLWASHNHLKDMPQLWWVCHGESEKEILLF